MYSEVERPSFEASSYLDTLTVPKGVPIVVNDVLPSQYKPGISSKDIDRETLILFASACFPKQPIYISYENLYEPTRMLLAKTIKGYDPRSTAFVFPGNGSRPLLESLWANEFSYPSNNLFEKNDIETARVFKENKPVRVDVAISRRMTSMFKSPEIQTVLVIDDVIASGMTMNAIREQLTTVAGRSLKFVALSWFYRQPSRLDGFNALKVVWRYQSDFGEGFPSLNSLSTWLQNDEKGFIVRENYKKKFKLYPYGFDKQLKEIKNLTTIV